MQRTVLTLATITGNNDTLDLRTLNFCLLELSHYETQCKKLIEMTLSKTEMIHVRQSMTIMLIKPIKSFEFFINGQTKSGLTSLVLKPESLLVSKLKGTEF